MLRSEELLVSLELSCQIECPLNKYGWTALHAACYFGHLNLVEYLVKNQKADVNGANENGWHSLIFAVYGGHLEIVDFLLYETRVSLLKRDTRNHRTACDIAE